MKTKKILIISGIIIFLGLAAAVSLGTYQLFAIELASRPSVQFLQPTNEQSVSLDDTLVRFIARDKEGIEHVELWVDGELYASKKSELPQGSTPFPFVEMWQPDSIGQHVLTARAYNSKNRDTVVSVVVQVSEETIMKELPMDLPPGDEGAEVPAPGDGVPPGDTGAEAPAAEEEEVEESVPMLDYSIPIKPLEGFLSEQDRHILDMIPRIRFPGDTFLTSARLLEVEAQFLETESGWDGVFCYLTLPGYIEEHIPDFERDGIEFITAGPGNLWDIQSLLGRENSRIVYLDEEALTLDFEINCWGAIREPGHGAVYDLGTLYASHDSSDWDGHSIEALINGPDGWFRIGYRINPVESTEDGLPAPQLTYLCWDTELYDFCDLTWDYPDDYMEEIDGFVIFLNDNHLGWSPRSNGNSWSLREVDGSLPFCSQTFDYQVFAYKGDPFSGEKSPGSNIVSKTAYPCYRQVKVKFDYLYLFCLSGDHDANCPVCFDICPGICGMDSDYFEPMFEAFGPDLFPFADCLHYYNINAYLASLRDDYEPGADYDMFWTPERAHFDDEGCSYGTLWVNDKEIEIGFSGGRWGYCFEMADKMRYQVADYSTGSKDTVYIPLDRYDSLVIGMNWYDSDRYTDDDRQCLGEYTHYPREIEEIASMDNQEKTYERVFVERGGGVCAMQYTIEVLPLDIWGFDPAGVR